MSVLGYQHVPALRRILFALRSDILWEMLPLEVGCSSGNLPLAEVAKLAGGRQVDWQRHELLRWPRDAERRLEPDLHGFLVY